MCFFSARSVCPAGVKRFLEDDVRAKKFEFNKLYANLDLNQTKKKRETVELLLTTYSLFCRVRNVNFIGINADLNKLTFSVRDKQVDPNRFAFAVGSKGNR